MNSRASHVSQLIKNLPAMGEIWVQSLGWEDPLKKGKATHSSILASIHINPVFMGLQKVGHDWTIFTFPVDEYLDYFRVLAIVNCAAMNIGVHVAFQIMDFSGYMPRSRIVGSHGNSIFTF